MEHVEDFMLLTCLGLVSLHLLDITVVPKPRVIRVDKYASSLLSNGFIFSICTAPWDPADP
jgi:hypothetical protein